MILNSAFARINRYVVVFESYGDIIKYRKVTDKKMKKDYFNTVELDPKPYSFRAPNNVKKVPDEVFPYEYAIMVPDGFLVPRKKRGAVYIMF